MIRIQNPKHAILSLVLLGAIPFGNIGNMLTKSDVGSYQYQNNNLYQASNIAGQNYTYDLNGNLTNDGTRTMAYNYQDRMASVTIGNRTTNYYYDQNKTRVAKLDTRTNAVTFYPNQYFEKESSTNNKTKYVFLGNQRIAIIDNEGVHLNFSDHLNSSSVTTDSEGNITNLIDYLPYGADRVNVQLSGNFDNKYKFTDKERDNESSLDYFGARYYNAAIGRFTQVDPVSYILIDKQTLEKETGLTLEQLLKDPQRLNSYSYSGNNPIIFIDADGNAWYHFGNNFWKIPGIKQFKNWVDNDKSGTAANISGGFTPIYGEAQDAYEIITGKGAYTGEKLSVTDRVITGGATLIPFVGAGLLRKVVSKSNKFVTLAHVSDTKFSEIMKNGFSEIKDAFFTNLSKNNPFKVNHLQNYIKYVDDRISGSDFGKIFINLPINIYNDLIKKGLLFNMEQETKVLPGAINIINKFIVK